MISVVIPALDEERALPVTLAAVAAQVPAAAEVIVVDGGSRDATQAIARTAGARVIEAPRGRACQMNLGARSARGEWLLFLHADTILPAGALATISALPVTQEAGCFRQMFDTPGILLDLTSRLHNWRCARTRIMYGDPAMFLRRPVFEAIGGFPDGLLEDVRLSEHLRRRAAPVLLPQFVVTSARRFREQGALRSLARITALLLQHRFGAQLRRGRRFFDPVR